MKRRKSALFWIRRKTESSAADSDSTVFNILEKVCPDDVFSFEMWQLGLEFYQDKLKGIVKADDVVLDIGCGAGTWSIAAANIAKVVTGIDIAKHRVDVVNELSAAKKLANVETLLGDVFSLNSPSSHYSAVICFNTLQLINNYDEVLVEVFRILKSGGKFYCSVPDRGILAYYLWESLYDLRPTKFLYIIKCVVRKTLGDLGFLTNESNSAYNGVYLSNASILNDLRKVGFVKCLGNTIGARGPVIYPKRVFGMPFFNEYVVEKP